MSSPSASEGEIIEKANTALPHNNTESTIDHQSRALFPDTSPRGEKRRRESGERAQEREPQRSYRPDRLGDLDRNRTDSRKHKISYDEGSTSSHQRRREDSYGYSPRTGSRTAQRDPRSRISYEDIDRSDLTWRYSRYEDQGRNLPFERRQRRRSRSPVYRGRREYRDRGEKYNGVDREDMRHKYDRRGSHSSGGSEARDYGSEKSFQSRNSAGSEGRPQAAGNRNRDVAGLPPNERRVEHGVKKSQPSREYRNGGDINKTMDPVSAANVADTAVDTFVNVKDSAEDAIDKRRARRQAIRARHNASQAPPLLVQALHQGPGSAITTPFNSTPEPHSARSASPLVVSPNSPNQVSMLGSPSSVNLQNDDQLANSMKTGHGEDAEEPSAADYDPTLDMKKDRMRNDLSKQNEMSAAAYDETVTPCLDVLDPASKSNAKDTTPKKSNGYDIFGDIDDDDAEPPAAGNNPSSTAPVQNLHGNWTDNEGYYMIVQGHVLDNRYLVKGILGKGVYSNVATAIDTKTDSLVAIKIVRANQMMTASAQGEISFLKAIQDGDEPRKKHIVHFERQFTHHGHLCMVFEYLEGNLRELVRAFGRFDGLSIPAIRSYARQMFLGLSLMKQQRLIHADFKPDNLLVGENNKTLKICDLGSAVHISDATINHELGSRFYRAPEVILGMKYDFAVDMWSVGCTLYELYTGKILFAGRTNNQMLRVIMECRGKFPQTMLKKARYAEEYFKKQDKSFTTFYSVEEDPITKKNIIHPLPAIRPTKDLRARVMAHAKNLKSDDNDDAELRSFIDLLDRCLTLLPDKRCTPVEALKHPFINRSKG